jgi:outer membrane protein assembly factor BamB
VFAGDHASTLMAVNADTGQKLWSHRLPGAFWGAPSTVMIDGQQVLLMPAGQTLTAFAIAPPARGAR